MQKCGQKRIKIKGMIKNSKVKLIISAILLGLIVSILFYGYVNGKDWEMLAVYSLCAFCGAYNIIAFLFNEDMELIHGSISRDSSKPVKLIFMIGSILVYLCFVIGMLVN